LPATRITPDLAVRVGSLAGRVQSVHRAAVHVELEAGDLLVVALDDVGGIPGGILIRAVADLRTLGLEPGMEVMATEEGLAIPAAAVAIDTADVRVWSPALPADARPTSRASIEPARAIAARRAPAGGFGPLLVDDAPGDERSDDARAGDPWLEAARRRIERQQWAFGAGDLASVLGEAVELIGLGPGLTPSGDDYLVGLLAGLEAAGHPAVPALASAVAHAAPGRTTAIGASCLAHAARGHYAERLQDVLIAMATGADDDVLARAIDRAMAYGATSGADTLVGLFAGIGMPSAGSAGWAHPADPSGDATNAVAAA
jgi:hypothetical protein